MKLTRRQTITSAIGISLSTLFGREVKSGTLQVPSTIPTSFEGADISAYYNKKKIASLQELTISITREVVPVFDIEIQQGFIKDKRAIAGNLIFTSFENNFNTYQKEDKISLFDIVIRYEDNITIIKGITLLHDGGVTVENLKKDIPFTYVAQSIRYIKERKING